MTRFEFAQTWRDRDSSSQFMPSTGIDAHFPKITNHSPASSHTALEYNQVSTKRHMKNEAQEGTSLVEQLSPLEKQHLRVAALLGMEVSVYEIARVAETSPSQVAITLSRAVALGILVEQRQDRFTFTHAGIHGALVASLAPYESLAAHARAAQSMTGSSPERVLRRVSHAFAAAQRSPEDGLTAVHIAREAAAILQAADDFEQAAAILGRALDLHEAAALPGPIAALVVEHAEAVLSCGLLAEARPLFHRASQLATIEGSAPLLARAALGIGGVWVREHRFTEEAERVRALQRRALDGLPPDETILRARLSTRIAVEQVYCGGPLSGVLEAVHTTRETGDAHALAEALSLYHHALLTPEHTHARLSVANELIATASVATDKLLSLMGLCWRAADLFLLGDPAANIALTELRLRANAVHCQSVLFIVRAMEVMLAIRSGQFDQAEQAATACYTLGTEVGDADAVAYYGAHLAAIRLFQGREAELSDLAAAVATSPVVTERDQSFATAAALFTLRQGDAHPARAIIERLKQDGIDSITPTSSWLLTMHGIIEIAAELKDEQIAQAAYYALVRYADLPIMASLAVVCLGSVHRSLAVAALTCGKLDLAIEHCTAAVAANERLGHRPATVQTLAELALALLQRRRADDIERGHSLLQCAMTEAEGLGMHGLISRWQKTLQTITTAEDRTDCSAVTITPAPQGGWRVSLGTHIATVPDLVGLRYLARLVAAPNQEISAVALVLDHEAAPHSTNKQEVMDQRTIHTLRQRICELRQQSLLTPDEQEELDTLTQELAAAMGLNGRVRTFADVPERARTAVRKAVKRAIAQITAANPIVGQHLTTHIETGAVCRYRVE
jgi:tetratricopeptide (TPR) repeat protein